MATVDAASVVAFSPGGRSLAVGDYSGALGVRLWDIGSRRQVAAATEHEGAGHEGTTNSIAFSLDGRYFASGGEDATVRLWDAATATQVARLGRVIASIGQLAFSPDGKTVAALSSRRFVHLYDVVALQETNVLRSAAGASAVAFSPDGRLLVASSDIWDARTGQPYAPFETVGDDVLGIQFSPDGRDSRPAPPCTER